MLSLEGKQLGNYDVIRRIRTGGMGAVYEGRQRTAFGRRVAIKVILGTYATDADMRRRFAREARTVARLHHPHILPLIEFGDEQGVLYLVMPFIEGGTLTGYLRRHLPDVNEVSALFLQILDAVEYAHEEGLIHRDIKSSNVLLEGRRSGPPYAYLADFGLVRTIQQAELESSYAGTPIPLDQVPGTPHYMAPEQTRGIVTTSSDIYALGVLLYQMLIGELPYNNPDDIEVIKMHLHAPVPDPCRADASIPTEIGAVVMQAMAKRPEQRFPDIASFRQSFLAAIDGPVERVEAQPSEENNNDVFEVHELPPAPPQNTTRQLPHSRQLAPEPIEFNGPQAKAGLRRERVTGDPNETPPRRSRITDEPDEAFQAGQRRSGHMEERTAQLSPRRPRSGENSDEQSTPRSLPRRPRVVSTELERSAAAPGAKRTAQTGFITPPILAPVRSRLPQMGKTGQRLNVAMLIGIAIPILLIVLLLLPRVMGLSFFPPGFPIFGTSPVATISLTIKSQAVQDTFLLTASPQVSQPDANKRLLPDHSISKTTSASRSVATSDQHSTPGSHANGTLLFVNNGPTAVNIASGFIFTTSAGLQIRLLDNTTVPGQGDGKSNSVSASATVVTEGAAGNIAANTINMPCCGGNVTVSNPQAFSGGSDGGVTHLVAQSDVDGVKNALTPDLKKQVLDALNGQLQNDEMLAGNPAYDVETSADPAVGQQATQVKVTVTVTATAQVYNARIARELASQLLTKEAQQSLGADYQLTGPLNLATPNITSQGDNGLVYLSIAAHGTWIYHISTQKEEEWRQAIKGASITLAQSYLTTRPGITSAHIQLPFGTSNLPTDTDQINFVIVTL